MLPERSIRRILSLLKAPEPLALCRQKPYDYKF
jgi:hypothetical protein